jgi:hypothetical protein
VHNPDQFVLEGFEDSIVPDASGLKWSYSRREVMDQCSRRYFYQYYSNSIGDPKFRARVKELRAIKNRHLRTGDLVHLVISTYLKKLKQGKQLSGEWASSWAQNLFAEDRRYSLRIRNGEEPSELKYPPSILDEIVSEVQDCDELLGKAEEQMLVGIRAFFSADSFAEFRQLGVQPNSLIEHKMSLAGFSVPVTGKIDLAAQKADQVTVVDWKLGGISNAGAESLQLAIYGIWATSAFSVSDTHVRIVKAHLGTTELAEFHASEDAFANARARIHQDLERMMILHNYGKVGNIEAFTATPHAGVCRLCPFREICPEGRAAIYA